MLLVRIQKEMRNTLLISRKVSLCYITVESLAELYLRVIQKVEFLSDKQGHLAKDNF